MDATTSPPTMQFRLTSIEDYEPLVGAEAIDCLARKASSLNDLHVAHVSSTHYGSCVADILTSLTLLKNSAGIRTGWRVIEGRPDFFSITKKMHDALRGGEINLTGACCGGCIRCMAIRPTISWSIPSPRRARRTRTGGCGSRLASSPGAVSSSAAACRSIRRARKPMRPFSGARH